MRAKLLELYLSEEQKKAFWKYMEGQTVSVVDKDGEIILSDSDVLDWIFRVRSVWG